MRTGHVYRSDSLAHVEPSDVVHLVEERGITLVVDLRREHEVETAPLAALEAAGVRVVHHSLIDPAVPPLQTNDIVDGTLADRYVSILDTSGAQFVSVLRLIADDANHPMVFQCAAGKDRTGLVAAMVLGLLGVDDETITTDYAATAAVDRPPARAAARPRARSRATRTADHERRGGDHAGRARLDARHARLDRGLHAAHTGSPRRRSPRSATT